ncbi:MAG: U32 family peptidase, partial [Spirochaetaceae bacterium]|nr:U32 family peptidase [Spirochaetaceae bacterium]
EDDQSAYYFSPRDLRLLEKIPLLMEAGINALKIEGRMKSADYTGCVVRAYRAAIDAVENAVSKGGGYETAAAGIEAAKELLKNDFARQKTTFYFDGRSTAEGESGDGWLNPSKDGGTGIKLGVIEKTGGVGGSFFAVISGDSGVELSMGDSVRIHRADDSARSSFKVKRVKRNTDGSFQIDIPAGFSKGDSVYLISVKERARYGRMTEALNGEGAAFSKHGQPGFEKAPYVKFPAVKKGMEKIFPEGLYLCVSQIEDMYAAQAARPEALIFHVSAKSLERLADEKKALPFKAKDIILSLPPFFAENDSELYESALKKLAAAGYSRYIVNNVGHISLLKKQNVNLIAGPYLYTFNRFAVSFLSEQQLYFFITPLENNRQNLERVFMPEERAGVFVTVFAYPRLFHICLNSGGADGVYDFSEFSGSRGERFKFLREDEASYVIPDRAFSIVDKIPFLKRAGFKHFIIDLSGPVTRKRDYKNILKAVSASTPLSGAGRFNWKDGFFTMEKQNGGIESR